jgi:hypothetical protein
MAYERGLALLTHSPFQQSLPREFHEQISDLAFTDAVLTAQREEFNNAFEFVQKRNPVYHLYEKEVNTRTVRYASALSESLQSQIAQDRASGHLKVKLVSEYALAQVKIDEKLLTLPEISLIQRKLTGFIALREEMRSQLDSNSSVIADQSQLGDVPPPLISHTYSLVAKLQEVNIQIETNLEKLKNQYLIALSLTYFEDMSLPGQSAAPSDNQTDELLSYIASAAVQRNLVLPPPQSNGPEAQSQWAKACLDALLSSTSSDSRDVEREPTQDETSKLKIALQDLQFAHQYLTNQFEEERNLNSDIMDSYKKKSMALENKLSESNIGLEKATQRSILVEHEKHMLQAKFEEKVKEVSDLKKEVALLKLDQIGSHIDSASTSPGYNNENRASLSSPLTGLSISIENEDSRSNPKTPLLQQSVNAHLPSPASPPKFSSSISVLRNEFKKMVVDLHNDYETQLDKEKAERKRLEHLLKLYEERECV